MEGVGSAPGAAEVEGASGVEGVWVVLVPSVLVAPRRGRYSGYRARRGTRLKPAWAVVSARGSRWGQGRSGLTKSRVMGDMPPATGSGAAKKRGLKEDTGRMKLFELRFQAAAAGEASGALG